MRSGRRWGHVLGLTRRLNRGGTVPLNARRRGGRRALWLPFLGGDDGDGWAEGCEGQSICLDRIFFWTGFYVLEQWMLGIWREVEKRAISRQEPGSVPGQFQVPSGSLLGWVPSRLDARLPLDPAAVRLPFLVTLCNQCQHPAVRLAAPGVLNSRSWHLASRPTTRY